MASPPPGASDHLSDLFFADLDLPNSVRAGIAACGFVRATPVQAATLPLLLAGRDVAAQAQTGTGKTAAFLVGVFTRLARHPRREGAPPGAPRALVVAPTRELAVQIEGDARALGHFLAPRIVVVYGGIDYQKQRDQLRRGCDLLIGTPGRLLDYAEQGATTFSEVEALVIDEADRLFDLGFLPDLRRILRRCPPPQRRHSMMFSATLSYRVMELAYEHLNQAERVEIRPEKVTADRVKQVLYHVASREKISLLLGLLRKEGAERTMLFVNTKRFAERLVNVLERHGLKVGALNGDIPQAKRLRILQEFKAGKLPLLVATDVASRGLHIEGVTHVVNVDLPQDPEDYVHRIGRTARAGASGMAISLACEDYVFSLSAIERLIGSKIPAVHADDSLFAAITPPRRVPQVMTGGGSRHIAPEREEEAAEEPRPAPAPTSPTSPVALEKPIDAPKAAAPLVATRGDEPPSAGKDTAEEAAPATEAVTESPAPDESETPDFWVREAFGLSVPEAGFGVAASAGSASPPSRRRRRRRRKGAHASETAAPTPAN